MDFLPKPSFVNPGSLIYMPWPFCSQGANRMPLCLKRRTQGDHSPGGTKEAPVCCFRRTIHLSSRHEAEQRSSRLSILLFNRTEVREKWSNLLPVTLAFSGETRPRTKYQDTKLIKSTILFLTAFKWSVNIVPPVCTSLWLQILLFIFTPAFLLLLARSEQTLYVCYYFQRGISQECPLPTFWVPWP